MLSLVSFAYTKIINTLTDEQEADENNHNNILLQIATQYTEISLTQIQTSINPHYHETSVHQYTSHTWYKYGKSLIISGVKVIGRILNSEWDYGAGIGRDHCL